MIDLPADGRQVLLEYLQNQRQAEEVLSGKIYFFRVLVYPSKKGFAPFMRWMTATQLAKLLIGKNKKAKVIVKEISFQEEMPEMKLVCDCDKCNGDDCRKHRHCRPYHLPICTDQDCPVCYAEVNI